MIVIWHLWQKEILSGETPPVVALPGGCHACLLLRLSFISLVFVKLLSSSSNFVKTRSSTSGKMYILTYLPPST
jgi:hypothetical protein